ncbi:MAG: phosphoribosylformimino-5-aminoimidazole carboxamide ribotide isomerase, partial [Lachnospiraceae bacterium]|nr:phosphoribosylformimino-5-aminoimidazole carboxamide ribotide isomerase [Lachnospiraceae bacterium]
MEYRPCIDIHNGKVKQIVGESLQDEGDFAQEKFVSERDANFFANFFKEQNLGGGHVIMLNSPTSPHYPDTKKQALSALETFPGGMMIGGGISEANAEEFLSAGASHVIMTSYIFHDGVVDYDRLNRVKKAVGQEHIVLDLSCKKKNGHYYVVTDRWSRFSREKVDLS